MSRRVRNMNFSDTSRFKRKVSSRLAYNTAVINFDRIDKTQMWTRKGVIKLSLILYSYVHEHISNKRTIQDLCKSRFPKSHQD